MRAGSGGLNGDGVLDIADVVRDELTILRKKIEDVREPGAFHTRRVSSASSTVRGLGIPHAVLFVLDPNSSFLLTD